MEDSANTGCQVKCAASQGAFNHFDQECWEPFTGSGRQDAEALFTLPPAFSSHQGTHQGGGQWGGGAKQRGVMNLKKSSEICYKKFS